MSNAFFNRSGNVATYQESPTTFIESVALGAALAGRIAIARPAESVTTGFLIEKDSDNWLLAAVQFNQGQEAFDEWTISSRWLEAGTLSYGDTVNVYAVLTAEMVEDILAGNDNDSHYAIESTASTITLTAPEHHNKAVVLTNSGGVTVTLSVSNARRPFCCHLIQGGTGQITLAAKSYCNYNGAGTNVAHVIPNQQYKKSSVYYLGYPHYLITS